MPNLGVIQIMPNLGVIQIIHIFSTLAGLRLLISFA